jgi:hypothetical protein
MTFRLFFGDCMITYYEATSDRMREQAGFKERDFDFPSLVGCTIQEIHITDRFPDTGYAKNTDCNLAIRVMKGHMTLFVYNEEQTLCLAKGASFEIPKNTPYYIIAEPLVVLLTVSEPPWDKKQGTIVFF